MWILTFNCHQHVSEVTALLLSRKMYSLVLTHASLCWLLLISVVTSQCDIMSCFCAQQTLFNSVSLVQKMGDASLRPLAQRR